MSIDHKAELDRHFAWFESKLPRRGARFAGWLRKPSSRLVRFPLGLLLMVGGVFSFLPVLGLWMLPLGLVLVAQDVPPLQKPTAKTLGWIERKWIARQRKKGIDLGPAADEPDAANANIKPETAEPARSITRS